MALCSESFCGVACMASLIKFLLIHGRWTEQTRVKDHTRVIHSMHFVPVFSPTMQDSDLSSALAATWLNWVLRILPNPQKLRVYAVLMSVTWLHGQESTSTQLLSNKNIYQEPCLPPSQEELPGINFMGITRQLWMRKQLQPGDEERLSRFHQPALQPWLSTRVLSPDEFAVSRCEKKLHAPCHHTKRKRLLSKFWEQNECLIYPLHGYSQYHTIFCQKRVSRWQLHAAAAMINK